MNIDITKYLKNKDVKIKNEDLDFDALEKDVYKGYVKEQDATKDMVKKSDFDTLSTKYAELETNYNNTIKTLDDTNGKLSKVSLEKTMISKGFKEDQFEKVSKMRSSLYADEKDDLKAIDKIVNDFNVLAKSSQKYSSMTISTKLVKDDITVYMMKIKFID